MNKQSLYKLIKIIPKPIRDLGKKLYNPVIPTIAKLDYGEDAYPEATKLMCDKLREVIENNVKGDVIEFGTFKGGTTLQLAKTMQSQISNKILYSLDTFEGLPEESKEDDIPEFYKNTMKSNKLNVYNMLEKNNINIDISKVDLQEGLFKYFIKENYNKKFCFAFIDCDLYEGTKEALEYLIPRMSKGGIIFIDDYYSKSFIGVKKAVNEFIKDKDLHKDLRVWWRK